MAPRMEVVTMSPPTHSVRPGPGVDGLVTHVFYQIATGKWRPGARVLSVRKAADLWGVDPRVVLKAFGRLEQLGLLEARPRSGTFVAEGPEPARVARHRHELERLFDRFRAEVREETGLSPLGAFHYFAHLANIRAREFPPCAFVECTPTQARGHADEVFARLGVPCLPVTLAELTPGLKRLPDHVHTVLISAFHASHARPLAKGSDRTFTAVPIEVSGELLSALPDGVGEAVLFESDETEARNILADVRAIGVPLALSYEVVEDVDAALASFDGDGRLALLSPRLWGAVDPSWRDHPSVFQVAFQVSEDAWPAIADTIGLPLGSPA